MSILERAVGPDHPDVAATLNNLGVVYGVQDRLNASEECYRRALAIWSTVLPTSDPKLETLRYNLQALATRKRADAGTQ